MSIKNFRPNKHSTRDEGYYKCKNPKKYIGDKGRIIYRSSYERKMFEEWDNDINIIRWVSEPPELKISYIYSVDNKRHTYYPDAYVEKIDKNGILNKFLIEIKPKSFLLKPKPPRIQTSKSIIVYKKRLASWIKIMNKKTAAEKFCEKHNMKYLFLTESYINRKS